MKKIVYLGIIIISLIITSSAFAAPIYCPITSHWYEAVSGVYNWTTARNNAVSMGGYLATLTSLAENNWVWSNLGNVSYYWIGGYQDPNGAEPLGGWTWVTGESWSWTNWNNGEPNNNFFSGHFEDNVQFWNNGKWNDINANSSNSFYGTGSSAGSTHYQGYIVEYATPEPATMSLLVFGLAGLLKLRKRKV